MNLQPHLLQFSSFFLPDADFTNPLYVFQEEGQHPKVDQDLDPNQEANLDPNQEANLGPDQEANLDPFHSQDQDKVPNRAQGQDLDQEMKMVIIFLMLKHSKLFLAPNFTTF